MLCSWGTVGQAERSECRGFTAGSPRVPTCLSRTQSPDRPQPARRAALHLTDCCWSAAVEGAAGRARTELHTQFDRKNDDRVEETGRVLAVCFCRVAAGILTASEALFPRQPAPNRRLASELSAACSPGHAAPPERNVSQTSRDGGGPSTFSATWPHFSHMFGCYGQPRELRA